MGFFKEAVVGAVGYGLGRHHKNEKNAEDEVKRLRNISLREYLDEYRDANHIVLETNTADSFIFELEKIVNDYKLGV
jgi:hypothetical protein